MPEIRIYPGRDDMNRVEETRFDGANDHLYPSSLGLRRVGSLGHGLYCYSGHDGLRSGACGRHPVLGGHDPDDDLYLEDLDEMSEIGGLGG